MEGRGCGLAVGNTWGEAPSGGQPTGVRAGKQEQVTAKLKSPCELPLQGHKQPHKLAQLPPKGSIPERSHL